MNGLLLPTGSKPPLKGDTRGQSPGISDATGTLSASPSSSAAGPFGVHPDQPPYGVASMSAATAPRLSISPPKPLRGGSSLKSASALAFIPRTSRTSAGIRKPVSKCSEFELADMLDRNERILATPLPSVSEMSEAPRGVSASAWEARAQAQARARERLKLENEDIRKELLAKRGMRLIRDGFNRWKLEEVDPNVPPTTKEALTEAMNRLSVTAGSASDLGAASRSATEENQIESLAWERDTLGVKKRLAEETQSAIPGSKVQQLSYEQSLALQTAALVAEMERERRADEGRTVNVGRDRAHNGLPAGTAHRLGRKSVSSVGLAVRKGSASGIGSGSPPLAHAHASRLGPCPGFGMPRRPSASSALSRSHDGDVFSAVEGKAIKSEEPDDGARRSRTASPSDAVLFADEYSAGRGADDDFGGDDDGLGDAEPMMFEDDFE